MKTAWMATCWNYRISQERNVWSIERNKQTRADKLANYLEKAGEMKKTKPFISVRFRLVALIFSSCYFSA